jgi:hypothetical protein
LGFFFSSDIPLNTEQTTLLFTPHERSLIAQAVHNEAMRLGLVPSTPSSISDNHPSQSQSLLFLQTNFLIFSIYFRRQSLSTIR